MQSDTEGKLIHTKCTVCRRKIQPYGMISNHETSTLLKIKVLVYKCVQIVSIPNNCVAK